MTKAERRKWSRKEKVVKVVEQSKQTENREVSTGAGTVEEWSKTWQEWLHHVLPMLPYSNMVSGGCIALPRYARIHKHEAFMAMT